ncbi:hypothetical protein LK996_00790 [Lysobacter sp. A6]|uniref:DUF1772 domain-containing protein n=1 Tax=Noviluteimonas lactosilytica TaxID=2888523 RepID=A0ABS8JDN4_9GAMM|nr:hypothetical protein [Lysobacter lactosilyticus]MCC8361620.1 hypothetical protein [Lysobacter lactosilyticus]
MVKAIVAVWIYLAGLIGTLTTAAFLAGVLAQYPASHIESFGPVVPAVSRAWLGWLSRAPMLLGTCTAMSAMLGIYLWRSRRPIDTRLFAAAVIAALNLFLAMFCAVGLLLAYFYLPKIANMA